MTFMKCPYCNGSDIREEKITVKKCYQCKRHIIVNSSDVPSENKDVKYPSKDIFPMDEKKSNWIIPQSPLVSGSNIYYINRYGVHGVDS